MGRGNRALPPGGGGSGGGEPTAAAAAALTSPVDGKVVPSHGVALPPPHRDGEAPGARALCGGGGGGGGDGGSGGGGSGPGGGGDGAPQLLWLSPSKPAPAALAATSSGDGCAIEPAPSPAQRDAPLPALTSIASPASLADAIDSILSAGPPEAALDLSPLLPLPPRLEAAVLAAAAEDCSAEEERQLGLAGVPLPRAVWGHPVCGGPAEAAEAAAATADEKMGPFSFDLWPPSYAEEAASLPPSQRVCALPALPFLPQGDFIARDVSRTFGELEAAVRRGEAAGAPPRAVDLLPTALIRGGDEGEVVFTSAIVARLRRRLQRVLAANTAYDRGSRGAPVIYTQGANYVVAFLLRHMGASASFWAFSSLCHCPAYALRDVYGAGLWRVKCAFSALESLAGERLPKMCARLRAKDIAPTSFATGWVMTLFSSFDALPPSIVAGGVWDAFLLRGWKAVIAAMLTVLEAVSPDISRMTELEHIVTLLHNIPEECLPASGGALAVYGRRWALSYKDLAARARQFDATAHPQRYEWARRVARARRLVARAAAQEAAAAAATLAPTVTAASSERVSSDGGDAAAAASEYDVVSSTAAADDDEEGDGGVEEKRVIGWSFGRRAQGLLRMMKPSGGLWGGGGAAPAPLPPPPPAAEAAAAPVEDGATAPSHQIPASGFAAAFTTLGAVLGIAAAPPPAAAGGGSRAPSRRQTEGSEVLDAPAGSLSHASSPRGPQPASPHLSPSPAPPEPAAATVHNTSVPTMNMAEFIVASEPPSPGDGGGGGGSPAPTLSIAVPAAMPTPFLAGLFALPPGSPASSPSDGAASPGAASLRPPTFDGGSNEAIEALSPQPGGAAVPIVEAAASPANAGGGDGGGGGGGGDGHVDATAEEGDAASPPRQVPGAIAWPSPRDDAPAAAPAAALGGGGGGVLAGLRARLSVNLSGLVPREGSFLRPRGTSTDEA